MQYFLIGYYGFDNVGDECCLKKTQQLILDVDSSAFFLILHVTSNHLKGYVNRWSFFAILKAIWRSDVIVFGGGSLLQTVTSRLSFFYYLSVIVLSKLCCKKVMLLGQGLGPVNGYVMNRVLGVVLSLVDRISIRDKGSYHLLIKPMKSSVILSSDLSFYREETKFDLMGSGLGLNLRPSLLTEGHVDAIVDCLQTIGPKLTYFVFQKDQDLSVLSEAHTIELSTKFIYDLSVSETEETVCFMVVMRYHAAVWCALRGIPFIALAYDPKVVSIAEDLGQEWMSISDAFDINAFDTLCRQVIVDQHLYKENVRLGTDQLMKSAAEHVKVFQ